MYTDGIRKIFTVPSRYAGMNLRDIQKVVDNAGYKALTFNSVIHIKTNCGRWVESPFKITDFQTN